MKNLICPICRNNTDIRTFCNLTAYSCSRCLHAWRPEPWSQTGQNEHFKQAHYTKTESMKSIYNTTSKLFAEFEKIASGQIVDITKTMLDFGCSYGYCMDVFKTKGWEVIGVEISPSAQEILNAKKLPWIADVEKSAIQKNSIDCIVIADSIYYVQEPVKLLLTLKNYLKESGMILLRQPTRAGFAGLINSVGGSPRIIQRLWCDHIHMFSRKSTQLALLEAGFSNINMQQDSFLNRACKGKCVHGALRTADIITAGRFDLTLAWIVSANLKTF
ncbi:MAG: hypothetical protein A2Y07_11080 [Planctomycetes bacterium GWF2_50_10]|nr:MAG: hypothetical protein A2Y07_11080 [Planctomycetes bacterium GWF2_50_10]